MKAIFTLALFFGIAAAASAQETMDQLDQQPQPVTEKQVERDARKAQEARKLNEEAAQREKENKQPQKKESEQRAQSQQNTNATTNGSRASSRPEKQ